MDYKEFDDLGGKLQDLVDRAVSSQNYQKLNQTINQTMDKAIDTGSEALKKALNGAFGQSGGYSKKYENKTREFEERRYRERMEQERREREAAEAVRLAKLPALYKPTAGAQTKGVLQTVFGGIFTLTFAPWAVLGLLGGVVDTSILAAGLVATAFAAGAGTLLAFGCKNLGRVSRFKKYKKALGTHTYCSFEQLSQVVGKPLNYVKKDIKGLISKGWFFEGHVDKQETCLITSNDTYKQYVITQNQLEVRSQEEARRAEEEKNRAQEQQVSAEVQEVLDRGNAYIRKIHASNDAIPGEEISAKISRMELIVEKIFQRAKAHPEIIPDLKRLMDYYLPMTVKLLDAYEDMDSQPIQGENIRTSKKEIEDTLDTLNKAFEKLLDSVFQDTAWDVSSDISVLHTMLAQEGLTESEFDKMKQN